MCFPVNRFVTYINPYCSSCQPAVEAMQAAVEKLGYPVPDLRSVLDDLDTAVALGITRPPALVLRDSVITQGSGSSKHIQCKLAEHLASHPAATEAADV